MKNGRNQYRIIYTSSYDRGLEHILKMWPDIKKEVPEATLHVFYGWMLFDRFYKDNPASMAWRNNMAKMLTQDGITDYGRMPQKDLIKEYEKSAIWAYPSHFGEINCLSAIKAQAYGCEPVVVNYAALKETVQYGRKIEGDIYDQETQEEFKKQLIEALKGGMEESRRKEMMKWATEKYAWSTVINSWDKEFRL